MLGTQRQGTHRSEINNQNKERTRTLLFNKPKFKFWVRRKITLSRPEPPQSKCSAQGHQGDTTEEVRQKSTTKIGKEARTLLFSTST
jgi:hypothetical protein